MSAVQTSSFKLTFNIQVSHFQDEILKKIIELQTLMFYALNGSNASLLIDVPMIQSAKQLYLSFSALKSI